MSQHLQKIARVGALGLLITFAPFTADAALTKHGSSDVSFEATATGGLAIKGSTQELRLAEQGAQLVITVPLAGLSTGISLRDRHMRDKYLEVGKYPNAELKVARSSLTFPADGASSTKTVTGTMTLHGRTNPAAFRYTAMRDGDVYRIAGAMKVNMTQYGIEQPSFMGITVSEEVSVRVRFEAKDVQ